MLSCLQEHPEVCVPASEVNYFSYEYGRSGAWYRRQFDDRSSNQKTGEKSPSYLAHPEAAARIHHWKPDVDLIFSLRHPVERAYSSYCMMLQSSNNDVGEDIENVLTADSHVVQVGRYFSHLERFRQYFPDEQLHVLIFDDLKEDPATFAQDLFETVGIDPAFEPSLLDRKYGHTKKRGGVVWSAIQDLSIRASQKSSVIARFIRWVRRRGYTAWIHQLRSGQDFPSLPEPVRNKLVRYYRDDVDKLRSYLGRPLPKWPG